MSVLLAPILLLGSPAQSQTQQKYARNSNGDSSIGFDAVLLSIPGKKFFFEKDICLILKRGFGDMWFFFFFFSKPKENTLVHPFQESSRLP